METNLTDRQERFVFEYMKDQNAAAAARRCGYAPASASWQGSRMMRIPEIRERVRTEMISLLAELRLSALDLMRERMRIAFFRSSKMFGEDGELLPVSQFGAEMRDLLDISVDTSNGDTRLKLRQPNRAQALAALEKVHERLDKLNQQHWDRMEVGEEAPPQEERADSYGYLGVENDPGHGENAVESCGPAPAQGGDAWEAKIRRKIAEIGARMLPSGKYPDELTAEEAAGLAAERAAAQAAARRQAGRR